MIKNDKIISIEMLKNLGIYELRELARSLGISSPTTKKRDELCNLIIKASKGEYKVEEKKQKRGRPPKSVTKIMSFVNEFIPNEIVSLQKKPDIDELNMLKLAQNPMLINQYLNEDKKQVYGFVNSSSGHYYLKNLKAHNEFKDLIFYIPDEIMRKFSIREGDKIVANGRMAGACYCGIIDEVLKINNFELGAYSTLRKREDIDLSGFEIPSQVDSFDNKEIKKGERVLVFFENAEEAIVKILEESEKVSEQTIILGVELAPEIIYFIKSKQNIEAFTTSFNNTLEESYEAIINSMNHANTLLREGKSVKFFIFDIMGILSRMDLYFSSKESNKFLEHFIPSIQLLKKIIGMGKSFSKGLDLTTFAVAFDNERDDSLINLELQKIFSRII